MNNFMKHHHPSIIFLPWIKVVCDGLITFVAIPVILLTITFVKILKHTLSKHIGRKYVMSLNM
jgi:hypothetical protein